MLTATARITHCLKRLTNRTATTSPHSFLLTLSRAQMFLFPEPTLLPSHTFRLPRTHMFLSLSPHFFLLTLSLCLEIKCSCSLSSHFFLLTLSHCLELKCSSSLSPISDSNVVLLLAYILYFLLSFTKIIQEKGLFSQSET